MDQSASVFGVKGSLLFVEFKPTLRATPVALPSSNPEPAFVVANTLVHSVKHLTAPVNYNLRVVEVTIAAEILAKRFGIAHIEQDGPIGGTFSSFLLGYFDQRKGRREGDSSADLYHRLQEAENLASGTFTDDNGYDKPWMAEQLGITTEVLEERYLTKYPVRAEKFQLRKRSLHVFRESLRVLRFKMLLGSESDAAAPEERLQQMADLMNESQESCRDLYQISCPEIDELCSLARKNGALASRVTGAGWGGYTLHLLTSDKVEHFVQALKSGYYKKYGPKLSEEELRDAIVVSRPALGSAFVKYT